MTELAIAVDKVVTIAYSLHGADGALIDEATSGDPLLYLHGHDNIVPGLERELVGKGVGARVKTVVAAVDGYGERSGGGPRAVPRNAFPGDAPVEEGTMFVVEDEGEQFPVWVVRTDAKSVWVDTNHPLAGQELHFEVEVLGIRDATREELDHGHPHGPHGHHHH